MRLTLRNLLAYLHKMMSSDDQAAFQQLLDGAPRAQQLLERLKELPTRRQLAAPALDQAHDKHSADTVSKYLDFELPDALLATFERAALESDEQLAEIVDCHRLLAELVPAGLPAQAVAWRGRLVALAERRATPPPLSVSTPAVVAATATAANDEYALAPVAEMALVGSAQVDIEQAAVETLLHESKDHAQYLIDDDDDDEDELSVEAARARQKRPAAAVAPKGHDDRPDHRSAPRRAVPVIETPAPAVSAVLATTVASPQLSTAESAALRLASYRHDEDDAVADDSDVVIDVPASSKIQYELAIPASWLIGGGVGGVVALGLLVWVVSAVFFAGPSVAAKGPLVYGIEASPSLSTVELEGTILNKSGGDALPDAGAMIVTWPVGAVPHTRLSAVQVLEDLSNARQNPYNDQLVTAKAGEDGRFRMRMMEYGEYHILIMSEKSQTNAPKTWGDAIKELQAQVDDPASVLGQRVYHYLRLTKSEEQPMRLEYTFGAE